MPFVARSSEFASWWQKTPGGNTIAKEKFLDKYHTGIKCDKFEISNDNFGHIISELKSWYFYKNFVVGDLLNDSKIVYFVFNEATCEKILFSNEKEFDDYIIINKLRPVVWTRKYSSNWGAIFTSGDFLEGVVFIYFKIPLLIILFLFILVGLLKTNFNLKHNFNRVSLLIGACVLIRIILDMIPNSF